MYTTAFSLSSGIHTPANGYTLKVKEFTSSIMRQETSGAFLKRLSAATQPTSPPPMMIAGALKFCVIPPYKNKTFRLTFERGHFRSFYNILRVEIEILKGSIVTQTIGPKRSAVTIVENLNVAWQIDILDTSRPRNTTETNK